MRIRKHRTMDYRGYILLYKPNHPHCKSTGYVYEHRVVLEKKLKRFLDSKELVHHLDGNPSNNKIRNLFLTDNHNHNRVFHKDSENKGRFTTERMLEYWKDKKVIIDRICDYCGKKFQVPPSRVKAKFCCKFCYWKGKVGTKNYIRKVKKVLNDL